MLQYIDRALTALRITSLDDVYTSRCSPWSRQHLMKKDKDAIEHRPMCECGKIGYDKKGAITAKNKRWHDEHEKLRVYQCHGKFWHLSSRPDLFTGLMV